MLIIETAFGILITLVCVQDINTETTFTATTTTTTTSTSTSTTTLGSPLIKKCACKASEVETNKGCLEKTQLYVQIWNNSIADIEVKEIATLPYKVEPLKCPDDAVLEFIEGYAFISEDGQLLRAGESNTYEYCLENVINAGGELFQKTGTCVVKYSAHLCCEVDEYMDSSSRCNKIPSNSMQTFAKEWVNKFNYTTKNVQCNDTVKLHNTIPLNTPLLELQSSLQDYDRVTEGNFCLGMYGDENELYPAVTSCSSPETDFDYVRDRDIPEIRYCCRSNEAYDFDKLTCVPHQGIFEFPSNMIWPENGAMESYSVMNCSEMFIIKVDNTTKHHFTRSGSMYTDSGATINFDEYCLGIILHNNQVHHSGLMCYNGNEKEERCPWRWDIYRICLGISSFFLVLTLIVYAGIADLRKRISGVCLISELTALLVSNITLIIIQTRQAEFSEPGCLAAGVIMIIFVLASFFWLNIMCYDVWSTFRVFRPFSEKVFNLKLFVKYSLYAWGIPILVGILAIVLEIIDYKVLKPNFIPGKQCFLNSTNRALQWFYLYGIILILLLINLGFFVHLAFTLITNQMENKKHIQTKGGNTVDKRSADIENLKLHGKLFVIMGLPWVIETLTSFASSESECYIWVLDLFNMLRGLFIFVIFVCKKSTKDKLVAEWFPSSKAEEETTSTRKISTTTMSLTNWLPSIHGSKISIVSLTSGGNVNLVSLKEEANEVIQEEKEEETKK